MSLSYLSACEVAGFTPVEEDYWENLGGWGIKIEGGQFDNVNHMDTSYPAGITAGVPHSYTDADTDPFKPPAQTNYDVFYDLDHLTWLRFIQFDIEPGTYETNTPGVYNFTLLHRIFQIVEHLKLPKGQNKKIYVQAITKTFGVANAVNMVPSYMRSVGNLGLTPPKSNNYETGFPRYDYLWGYISTSTQDGASPWGYHYRFADMRAGLTGTDRAGRAIGYLLQRQIAFYTEFYTEFKDYKCFGGMLTTEGIPVTRTIPDPDGTGTITVGSSYDSTEFNRDQHFDGRLNWLKQLKAIFTNHVLIEACHHDNQWQADMTGAGRNIDGAIKNHFAVTGPNNHTGNNLDALYQAKENCGDILFIYGQTQPQDMKKKNGGITKTGTNDDCFDWIPDPNHVPPFNCSGANPYGPLVDQANITGGNIPDPNFLIWRHIWLKVNAACYQHNYDFAANPNDWDTFRAGFEASTIISVNTGGLIKDDTWGGLRKVKPSSLL